MLHLLLLLFVLVSIIILYNNYDFKNISKKQKVVREGVSSKCSKSDVQEMAGLVFQLNGRVKNLEKEINKVKLISSKALSLAKENKKDVDTAKDSIKEEQGEMKIAEKELEKVGSGL